MGPSSPPRPDCTALSAVLEIADVALDDHHPEFGWRRPWPPPRCRRNRRRPEKPSDLQPFDDSPADAPRVPPVTRATFAHRRASYLPKPLDRVPSAPDLRGGSASLPFHKRCAAPAPDPFLIRSTQSATPMPPPTHRVARPFLAPRRLHFVQQGGEDARTRSPDRMADGDGAAVDVRPVASSSPSSRSHAQGLGREGLVAFDQGPGRSRVQPAFCQGLAGRRGNGAGAHDGRIDARRCAHDAMRARAAFDATALAASSAVISTSAAAPSFRPEALAAVTVPSLEKAGLQPRRSDS